MSDRRVACAVVGASGYIGQHFARLLADHPWFEPPVLVSTERSEGRTLADIWQLPEPPPEPLAKQKLISASVGALAKEGVRVAFSALPSGTAGPLESELVRLGDLGLLERRRPSDG